MLQGALQRILMQADVPSAVLFEEPQPHISMLTACVHKT